jgi:dolichol-phosphate mannosyltransferase
VRATVVIPTYNEVDNLEPLCTAIRKHLPAVGIIVVDDASTDGTAALADDLAARLGNMSVLHRPGKLGLGSAYRLGLRTAITDGADICVQMDADFSHDPEVLPALVGVVEYGADLCIGSRYVPGGRTENWPWKRRALSRWGNRYAAGVLGLAINDATAGYRAYRSTALEAMHLDDVTAEGYGFQIEMTNRLVGINGKVVEFPIVFRDRTAGQSKMSGGIVNEALVLVLKLWLHDFRRRRERRATGG